MDTSDLETHRALRFVQHDALGLETLLGRSRLAPNQEIILTPCIELVVLGRSAQAPTFLRQPYERFLSRWREQIRFWWDGGTQSRRPKQASLDKVATRLSSTR